MRSDKGEYRPGVATRKRPGRQEREPVQWHFLNHHRGDERLVSGEFPSPGPQKPQNATFRGARRDSRRVPPLRFLSHADVDR